MKGTREKTRVTMNLLAAFLSALLLGGVAVFPGQPRAEIYKFTDRNGVIHFTNIPDQPRYQPWFKDSGPSRGERLDRYSRLIKEVAERHDVEPALIKALVRAESDFNPSAISKKGAIGLMQLMPETLMDLDVNNPFAPAENLEAGVKHLKKLLNRFNNDIPLAVAAYNAGAEAVLEHNGVPPYRETTTFVERVLRYFGEFSRAP